MCICLVHCALLGRFKLKADGGSVRVRVERYNPTGWTYRLDLQAGPPGWTNRLDLRVTAYGAHSLQPTACRLQSTVQCTMYNLTSRQPYTHTHTLYPHPIPTSYTHNQYTHPIHTPYSLQSYGESVSTLQLHHSLITYHPSPITLHYNLQSTIQP
jgi:hypothetical protein